MDISMTWGFVSFAVSSQMFFGNRNPYSHGPKRVIGLVDKQNSFSKKHQQLICQTATPAYARMRPGSRIQHFKVQV